MTSISEQQLKLYMPLFRGRTDVYARHWEKDGRSGYSPAYEFNLMVSIGYLLAFRKS